VECSARGKTCRGLTWGSSHYARFSNGARDRKSPAKPPRENPVNQSGSVALSAEEVRGPPQTQVIDKNSIVDHKLRTRGSWVQVLPGAPFFKGLERKTRSSFSLWDPCGTSYPPVLAASMLMKDLACKTKCSSLCCGTLWDLLSKYLRRPSAIRNSVGVPLRSTIRFA
jgi:hypothetical protein